MIQGRTFQPNVIPNVISAFLVIAALLICGHSAFAQASWQHIGVGGGGYFSNVKIDPNQPDTMYVGSDVTGLFRSFDGGDTWDTTTQDLGSYYVGEILLAGPDGTVFVSTKNATNSSSSTGGGVYKSTDAGATFERVLPETVGAGNRAFFALAGDPSDSTKIYAGEGFFRYESATEYGPAYNNGPANIFMSPNLGDPWISLGQLSDCGIHSIIPVETNPLYGGADELYVSASDNVGVVKGTRTGESTWTWSSINGSGGTGLPHRHARDLEATFTFSGQLDRLYVVLDSQWEDGNPGSIYNHASGWGGGVWFSSNGGSTWYPTSVSTDNFNLDVGPKRMRNLAINRNTGTIYVTLNNAGWAEQGLWRGTPGVGGPTDWVWEILTDHRVNPFGQFDGTPEPTYNFERTYQPNLAGCEGLDIDQSSGDILFTSSMHAWLCEGGNCLPGNCLGGNCEETIAPYWKSLDTEKTPGTLSWTTTGMDDTQAFDITVDPQNSSNWYLAQGDIGLLRSTNGGQTWTPCIASAPYTQYLSSNCRKILPNQIGPTTYQWIGVFGSWSDEGDNVRDFDVWTTSAAPSDTSTWTAIPFFNAAFNRVINDVLVVGNYMAVATDLGIYKSFGNAGTWGTLSEWTGIPAGKSKIASRIVADPTGIGPNRKFVVACQWESETVFGGIYYATKFGGPWQAGSLQVCSPQCDDCWRSVYSLEWSSANSQVVHAGSGNPRGCYLQSTNKGVTWTYVSDFSAQGSGNVSVVDLVETTTGTVLAAIDPARYGDSLEETFGGIYAWSGIVWNALADGLDAGHMTFLKADPTNAGRLFCGTMGNGAYITDLQPRGSNPPLAMQAKEGNQPSLHEVRAITTPGGPSPSVRFALGAAGPVSVYIYDVTGRQVRLLLKEQRYAEGPHSVTWDGVNDSGQPAASGVYYARVLTPIASETVKIVMVR